MRIAYLAPEIPALSATFVYEELLALERRGFDVLPLSVHRPAAPAHGQAELARRTTVVYDRPKWLLAFVELLLLPFHRGLLKALGWLWSDLRDCRFCSGNAAKLAFQFLAAGRVARLLTRHGCRHLHIHFVHVPTQIGMYASALAGVPYTCTAHANDIFERGLLLPQKAARSARMLTVSRHNLVHLLRLGVPVGKLAVVRCGVSLAARAASGERRPGPWRIGSLGRLVEKKGMDVLLKAVAALPPELAPEVEIAGDGPLRFALETLAAELGIAERVRFVGALAHADVAAWLAGLDVFALACRPDARGDMDGIPVVLMEAMSQGVPVVSTRLSGIPELVIDGRTGLLAEPGDANSLAERLARLLDSAPLRGELAARALAHVRGEFGQDTNLDRLIASLDQSQEPSFKPSPDPVTP